MTNLALRCQQLSLCDKIAKKLTNLRYFIFGRDFSGTTAKAVVSVRMEQDVTSHPETVFARQVGLGLVVKFHAQTVTGVSIALR